jgi:uncharacterized protein YggE
VRISRIGLVVVGTMLALTACGDVDQTPIALAQEGTITAMNGISVSGRGEVFGTPDTLTVTIGVSVGRSTVSEAVDVAAGRATDLIAALEGLGVAEEDIQTSNYSVYPEYEYRENQAPRITGYRVDNTLDVKIRDLDRAGEVLDAATAAAGDEVRVNGVSFVLEDNDALVVAARAAAWEDAKAKAEQLADLADVRLGAPLTISESLGSVPVPMFARAEVAPGDVATPIRPGQETVSVDLTVTFAIDS